MNRHALEVLQYPQALDLVAGFASGPLGGERVRTLQPSTVPERIRDELQSVSQMVLVVQRSADAVLPNIPDVREPLHRLATPGSVLDAVALRDLADLMYASRTAKVSFRRTADWAPRLAHIAERLAPLESAESAVRHAIDESGEVRDRASRELSRIRREIKGARSRIVQKLEQFMATLPARFMVTDASVTVRDGRFVIPIRREGRGEVGGLVHDESATGQTLYIEPPLAIELMNRLRELEIAEVREIQRILRELSDSLRPERSALETSLDALVELDSLYARARYAIHCDGHTPEMLAPGRREYEMVSGRHPLLLGTAEVVPFDLSLSPDERTLLVSGPNTGGKTVLLKAVGLLSTLSQAGVIAPVGPGTRLPILSDVFADIGDEQSIEASLSTFSAHLRNLSEILAHASAESLVLIDEMGSGTDPVEGAALARSILVELTRRGAFTVATTHLGELKALAADEPGVVNASLDFDAAAMQPTYRLRKGVPGRSYGLAIARRLGVPSEVLERAESFVPRAERQLGSLLEEVEEKDRALADALRETESARREALELRRTLHEREATLEARERTAERRARQQARDLLLAARNDVEAAIRELRDSMAKAKTDAEREEAARVARRHVEERARTQARRTVARPASRKNGATVLRVGDHVRVESTGAEGTILELRDGRAVIDAHGLRLSVNAAGLVPAEKPAPAERPARGGWYGPDFDATSELDLRGLRADEVANRLQPAIDAAVQAALPSLRIIHGKGTGALRDVVNQLLKQDARVTTFRPGGIGEGGTGVTIAELS
jgi:DNA mismatch repair protein MutS2